MQSWLWYCGLVQLRLCLIPFLVAGELNNTILQWERFRQLVPDALNLHLSEMVWNLELSKAKQNFTVKCHEISCYISHINSTKCHISSVYVTTEKHALQQRNNKDF